MSQSRRSSTNFARIAAAAALLAAPLQPAVPQARTTGPRLLQGQEIVFTVPQFAVHALWFKANDETNWYWMGSDEVYAVFSDMDPTHNDRRTRIYGDVDEGDTVSFVPRDRCMAAQPGCDRGMASLNVRFSFWERDSMKYNEFCPGTLPGSHDVLENGMCPADDFIGHGAIIHSQEELVAMLPDVGAFREATVVMDQNAGKYRFRYRITRLANTDRTLVIHLPPDIGTTPTITLQGTVVTIAGQKGVRLTWSGATTNQVDIYRDGAKVLTTVNDGDHVVPATTGTFQFRLCDLNSTTACSAQISVTVT